GKAAHLARRILDRPTHLPRDLARDFGGMALEGGDEALDDGAALGDPGLPPGGLRTARRPEGMLDLAWGRQGPLNIEPSVDRREGLKYPRHEVCPLPVDRAQRSAPAGLPCPDRY